MYYKKNSKYYRRISHCTVVFSEDGNQVQSLSCVGRLRFEHFDMAKVLANSTHLMASEGKEFDLDEDSTLGNDERLFPDDRHGNFIVCAFPGIDNKEKMAKQRQMLNARLGLDVAAKLGMDTTSLFSNDDLAANNGKLENLSNNIDLRVSALRGLLTFFIESY